MSNDVSEYRDKVYRYFLRKTNREQESNDLTQEVFVKVINHWDRLHSINDVNAWIFSISRNVLIDHFRKNKRSAELVSLGDDIGHAVQDKDQEELINSMLTCQQSFLERLDPETRFLLQKSDIEGISQKELAESSDMVYATVRSKIQRGRNQLKKMFMNVCEMEYDSAGNILSCNHKNSCSTNC